MKKNEIDKLFKNLEKEVEKVVNNKLEKIADEYNSNPNNKFKLKTNKSMSQDITFQKSIKVQDVIDKTSLTLKLVNGSEWLVSESGATAALIRGHKEKEYLSYITRYGFGAGFEDIMNEIVLTFQTKFITDNEEEMLWHDKNLDADKMFDDTTKSYGYKIIDGVISIE